MADKSHWWCKDCSHDKCPCPFQGDLRPCFNPAEQCPENAPVDSSVNSCANTTE